MNSENRREVKSRRIQAFHRLAFLLVGCGLTPNAVSVVSAVFAALGAASLIWSPSPIAGLIGYFLGIQLRLICNLVDGLMAVEGGKRTPYGEFFNDFPDRVSDVVLILAPGIVLARSVSLPLSLGIAGLAAILAVFTAYIRVLGASMKAPHFFCGPMAKQHRMAVLNLATVASLGEYVWRGEYRYAYEAALTVIALGSLVTCVRRTRLIIGYLSSGMQNSDSRAKP